ncbi:hypothetical protein ACJJTC_015089 [Scirpophaga incertulas]
MSTYLLVLQAMRDQMTIARRKRQRKREQFNILGVPDAEFINAYRLTKSLFEQLCQDLVPLLPVKRNSFGIDPAGKILITLNFFARGSYQGSVGKDSDVPMTQQTVSRCIREVTQALNQPQILAKYIRFPQTRQERTAIKSKFYERYRLPGICGCIDCAHIAIIPSPSANEERFFNRKSYHSLNVQMICDADNFILNVDASYGGSTHDSFIWNESEIKSHLESLVAQGETAILLGDSGYPLREYLITPYGEQTQGWPEGSPENSFNKIQKEHRQVEEQQQIYVNEASISSAAQALLRGQAMRTSLAQQLNQY